MRFFPLFYVAWKTDRDLKPANILLLSDCQLRITDFGLCRRIKTPSPPSEDEKLTMNDAANDELSLAGCTFAQQAHGKGLLAVEYALPPKKNNGLTKIVHAYASGMVL